MNILIIFLILIIEIGVMLKIVLGKKMNKTNCILYFIMASFFFLLIPYMYIDMKNNKNNTRHHPCGCQPHMPYDYYYYYYYWYINRR